MKICSNKVTIPRQVNGSLKRICRWGNYGRHVRAWAYISERNESLQNTLTRVQLCTVSHLTITSNKRRERQRWKENQELE